MTLIVSDPISCDIFCKVIDNLGDAGVCWRLARQLAREHGWRVRLWIDDPAPLTLLAPDRAQIPVEVCQWSGDLAGVEPAAVVIEAFACELPPAYVATMRGSARPPVWINLEYLSAEDWVAGCHGLPSPQFGLKKFFFFPGFVPGTGGLLRERNHDALIASADSVSSASTFRVPLEVSLFCYANPALPDLLAAWRDGDTPVVCQVAAGLPQQQVAAWLGTDFPTGSSAERGRLSLHALPFLSQDDYDRLLARCQLNFIRGEDSFVRAQWAARPFVWQAYPQTENGHLTKLAAFLKQYPKVDADDTLLHDFWFAWNGSGSLDWPKFAAHLPELAALAPEWAKRIAAQGDLAMNLVKFVAAQV